MCFCMVYFWINFYLFINNFSFKNTTLSLKKYHNFWCSVLSIRNSNVVNINNLFAMNHRLFLCIVLIFLKISATLSNCDKKPNDVDYEDCPSDKNDKSNEDLYYSEENTESTNTEQVHVENKLPENVEEKSNLFYDAIKDGLTNINYTNYKRFLSRPSRVECIIKTLRENDAMSSVNSSHYSFEFNDRQELKFLLKNLTATMSGLERAIQDANFDCLGMKSVQLFMLIFIIVLSLIFIVIYLMNEFKSY